MSETNTINLLGILKEDLELFQKIINTFYQKLEAINVKSSILCSIVIENIEMKNINNCSIIILNKCITNNSISLNILLGAIIDNIKFIPENIKERLEKNLGVILNPNIDQSGKGFLKRCSVDANVSNKITIEKLIINGCEGESPLKFQFINSGNAQANCGMVELINALSKKTDNEENDENLIYQKFDFLLGKVLNLNLTDLMFFLIIFSVILFIILCLYLIFFKQNIKCYRDYIDLKKIEKRNQKNLNIIY